MTTAAKASAVYGRGRNGRRLIAKRASLHAHARGPRGWGCTASRCRTREPETGPSRFCGVAMHGVGGGLSCCQWLSVVARPGSGWWWWIGRRSRQEQFPPVLGVSTTTTSKKERGGAAAGVLSIPGTWTGAVPEEPSFFRPLFPPVSARSSCCPTSPKHARKSHTHTHTHTSNPQLQDGPQCLFAEPLASRPGGAPFWISDDQIVCPRCLLF